MADELHTIEIAFKNPPNQPHIKHYRITKEQRDKIEHDYSQKRIVGTYDVQTTEGDPRVLMVHFADVLYIA